MTDYTSIVVAVVGAFTALTGWALAKRAQKDVEIQKSVADAVERDRVRLDETQQALDAYERVIASHEREIDRLNNHIAVIDEILRGERIRSASERQSAAHMSEHFRKVVVDLLEALLTLRSACAEGPLLTRVDEAIAEARGELAEDTGVAGDGS
jgi:hypothetical protein